MTKKRVYLGIPSTGTRSDAQIYLLEEIKERYKDHVELVYPTHCVYRTFHDFARNAIVEDFLVSDCDVLWFLDSDVVPPKHVMDLVALHWDKWEASGACYPIWMVPPGGSETCVLFTAYKGIVDNDSTKGITMTEVPKEGQEFIDGLATGCMFLKKSVFKDLQKPYFEFKFNPETRQMKEGEDLGFCLKLSKLGIKFFTDYSMVCKHYKQVCLLDVSNYAMSRSNFNIMEYDKEIRGKVQDAIKSAYSMGKKDALNELQETLRSQSRGPQVTQSGLILPG